MKNISLFVVFSLLIIQLLGSQYVPISKTRPGIVVGNKQNPIEIQLIYDPACSDSRDFDKKWRVTYENLDSTLKKQIVIKYIPTIIPPHLTGQKLTQAILIVRSKKGDQQAVKCLRYFLDNQQQWDENKIMNQTISHLITRLSQKIQQLWGIPSAEVQKGLLHGSQFDGLTRYWAKYAMGTLSYAAVPKMFINGAKIDQGTDMTQDNLVKLLKSLI